jgi:hypothetical protein
MISVPKISAVFQRQYPGGTVISLNGKIVGIGKDGFAALKKAKKILPGIEKEEFLVSRILPKYLEA